MIACARTRGNCAATKARTSEGVYIIMNGVLEMSKERKEKGRWIVLQFVGADSKFIFTKVVYAFFYERSVENGLAILIQ